MLHLHIKILPGAQRIVFLRNVLIADDNREVLDDFIGVEDADDLGDDLVFVAVVAEAVVGADGLEVVDEGDGLDLEVAGGHGVNAEKLKTEMLKGREDF